MDVNSQQESPCARQSKQENPYSDKKYDDAQEQQVIHYIATQILSGLKERCCSQWQILWDCTSAHAFTLCPHLIHSLVHIFSSSTLSASFALNNFKSSKCRHLPANRDCNVSHGAQSRVPPSWHGWHAPDSQPLTVMPLIKCAALVCPTHQRRHMPLRGSKAHPQQPAPGRHGCTPTATPQHERWPDTAHVLAPQGPVWTSRHNTRKTAQQNQEWTEPVLPISHCARIHLSFLGTTGNLNLAAGPVNPSGSLPPIWSLGC